MKKFLLKTVWLFGVVVVIAILTLTFTGITQTCMEYIADHNGYVLAESTLYGVSGTLGAGVAAILVWVVIHYDKRLCFYRANKPKGKVWTTVFIVFTVVTCRVVFPGIWTYVSSITGAMVSETVGNPDEPLWQMIVFGVILAPWLEELLFRKDIFSLLLRRFSMPWSIGLSAFLFAVIHGYSAEGFISCLLAGALFAILMAMTGRLIPCIIAHTLCNVEALVYNILENSGSPLIVNIGGHTAYDGYIFALSCVVMFLSGAYLLKNTRKCMASIA